MPNNQNILASTPTSKPLPLDNYKNNILKAKARDENKKVGGNAMLSFSSSGTGPASTAASTAEDISRYVVLIAVQCS